jgi:Fe2+ transport system protein FeoA
VVIALLDRSSDSPEISTSSLVPLDSLTPQACGEIVELPEGHGAARRLAELGIFVGAHVKVVRLAPLGGPVLLDVRGSLVALGRRLAHRIWVRELA